MTGFIHPGPAGPSISSILADRSNSVWIGTHDQGLFRLDQAAGGPPRVTYFAASIDDPSSLSDDRITSIFEDRQGTLWIGTFGGGLNRFNKGAGTFTRFTTHDGLPNNVINGIAEDDEGKIWLATRQGFSSFQPGSPPGNVPELHLRGRIAGKSVQRRRVQPRPERLALLGGLSGLTALRPGLIRPNPQPPTVEVTDFKLFNKSVDRARLILGGESIRLDYSDAQFAFEFTALDFSDPQKNQFAYRLMGLESRWTYTDAAHRKAVFYKPEPGEYMFELRAANSDGTWNETGWAIPVVINPPYYRSPWFLGLAGLGILVLAGIVARSQFLRSRRKEAGRLEMVNTMVEISETERQRIGLELHDNLSHDLVAIAVQCRLLAKRNPDLSPETGVIEEKIKEAIQQTRSIARGLFPLALAQNGLPAMLDEIRYMVERDYQIPCEAGLDQEIQVGDLRVATHLYYIAREAMLNAARHSGTDRLFIGLRRIQHTIVLVVRDYGRGAQAAQPGAAGMGLKIMEYRAQLIGGHFEIRQPPDGGTEIVCSAPLPAEPPTTVDGGGQEG